MKAKKDWTPPNWDALMDQMKEEGRDAASMDADLKDIMHDKSDEQKGTGTVDSSSRGHNNRCLLHPAVLL